MREQMLEPDVISYNAGISACEKGGQWEQALRMLSEIRCVKLEPNLISYSAGISTCEKGEQWEWAVSLLNEMLRLKLEPGVISATMLGLARARKANSGSVPCCFSIRCLTRGWNETSLATVL
ncbi:unnamed protein product [Prorocentrum cordatum]|uniref:Pentatricopeptide repeat-containing protein n=1 Tax=Prorocentrum cordatum TaxID=2364126 RepID=A0ABN9UTI9_9DINO|nr:unnamed protein product [Polarella glacialis]